MSDFKLAKLPDRTPVKLTIAISPELNQALADYAALYRERYGASEPIGELIPAMLSTFLESDRAYTKARRGKRPDAQFDGT